MNKKSKRTGLVTAVIVVALVSFGGLVSMSGQAAGEPTNAATIDEEKLTQRIAEEVMIRLREGDFLDRAIEAGIERYIQKQRQAQEATRAQQQRAANAKAKNVRPVSQSGDHIFGNPDAVISLIEYSDFECPYCKRFHPTARDVVESYDGKVNWVYRHFPLAFHNPGAQKQAEASECANELGGNEAFWEYTDLIYERTTSNGTGFPIANLVPLAQEIGLNTSAFQTCLDSGKYAAHVQEDFVDGSRSGISGTPGNILLNNQSGEAVLKPGAVPLSALKAEVDRLLN